MIARRDRPTNVSLDHQDKWLDLIERFAARGARVSVGNLNRDMIAHLLDVIEDQEVRIRGLEDKLVKLRKDLGDG